VPKNEVLRRIVELKKNERHAQFKVLHNEELHNFYGSLSVVRIVKCRRLQWAELECWSQGMYTLF